VVAVSLRDAFGMQVIHNKQVPTLCNQRRQGYCFLASHYKMLLQLFFACLQSPRLIMLEEDLEIAPDFFPYMEAAAAVMDRDRSVWCVSAWNDHGQPGRARNSTALYRTDVLPGLGWMMPKWVGQRIWRHWPRSNWDDWMRMRSIRQNRQCIYPEVPRTHTFGKVGTSQGEHYDVHLKDMLLNQERVDWKSVVSGE
jgi:alpha-1,3-mannosyl-glycoprotein beta-1,2-N-acetylglucosaminyltransferase